LCDDPVMAQFTDEQMEAALSKSREYTLVILHRGDAYGTEGSQELIWEHGRRNFELRAAGKLAIVGPIPDDSDTCGLGIFAVERDEAEELMREDPAIKAGIFAFVLHPYRSFPGDALPA
jgi:hypothetical protein